MSADLWIVVIGLAACCLILIGNAIVSLVQLLRDRK